MKEIQVLKFGGTSLNSDFKLINAVKIISQKISNDIFPIIVVSALGRKGEPYATDTLLNLINQDLLLDKDVAKLISCGEVIASIVLANALVKNDIKAISLNGFEAGILTDASYLDAKIKAIDSSNIIKMIKDGIIPIITGFQGVNSNGNITTLGRGGSDFTAAAVAVALKASGLHIYKETDGIFTTDPRIVKDAYRIDKMDFSEVFELTSEGAKVIYKETMQIAFDYELPVFVKSFADDKEGTEILKFKQSKIITGITAKENIVTVSIKVNNKKEDLKVFSIIAKNGISADFIDIRDEKISFIADEKYKSKLKNILSKKEFIISDEFVKISLVGAGMTGIPGVVAKIIETLQSADIELFQTTDSHTTISCLIKKTDYKKALNALHNKFLKKEHK